MFSADLADGCADKTMTNSSIRWLQLNYMVDRWDEANKVNNEDEARSALESHARYVFIPAI